MKKIFTLFAVAMLAISASAEDQGFSGNKFWDNWYVGVNGGVGTATTHQALFKNLNPNAGVRVGKLFSPVFGLAVEGNFYFRNRTAGFNMTDATVVRYHQLGFITTFNLMNAFGGYNGEPRRFEILAAPGFAWGHNYGRYNFSAKKNTLVSKLALDFCYNLGKKMAWTVYLEPSLNYVIAGTRDEEIVDGVGQKLVVYDINSSFLQLNLGVNYKFKTSNGSHNFAFVEACNQDEIEALNNTVNELRQKANDDEAKVVTLKKEQETLQNKLKDCAPVVTTVKETFKEPDLPAVFYQVNKSIITPAQQPNVQVAAEVMKNHPEYNLLIKGYASPEGPHDNNTSLGIRRANAVKTMLVNKYKIAADRITAEGCGETDELFPIYEFNRVAVMFLQKK